MSVHQFPIKPGISSYQSPALTPLDFWTQEPHIPDLLEVMDEYEMDALAVMLQDVTEAYRFGRDYKTPARELADWLMRLEQSKRGQQHEKA